MQYFYKKHKPKEACIYDTVFIDEDLKHHPSAALQTRKWRRAVAEVNDKNVSFAILSAVADAIYVASGRTFRAAHVSIKYLAEKTGLSERSVSEALRVLRRSGFIDVSHTYKKWHGLFVRGASYIYLAGFIAFLKFLTKQGSDLIAAGARLLRGIKSSIRDRDASDHRSGPEPPIRGGLEPSLGITKECRLLPPYSLIQRKR